jgi:hypothetical protein
MKIRILGGQNMKESFLNKTGNRAIFKVPENYFSNFEIQLNKQLDVIEAEKISMTSDTAMNKGSKRGLLLNMEGFRPLLYMASMFVLLLFSIAIIMQKNSGETQLLKAQKVSKEQPIPTAEDYLISNLGTYSISQYYIESKLED